MLFIEANFHFHRHMSTMLLPLRNVTQQIQDEVNEQMSNIVQMFHDHRTSSCYNHRAHTQVKGHLESAGTSEKTVHFSSILTSRGQLFARFKIFSSVTFSRGRLNGFGIP